MEIQDIKYLLNILSQSDSSVIKGCHWNSQAWWLMLQSIHWGGRGEVIVSSRPVLTIP